MKKVLVALGLSTLCLCGCSAFDEKENSENVVSTIVTETVTEPNTELPQTDFISETKIIGEDDFGYLEVSDDWEYEEPMVYERPSVTFNNGFGNSIVIYYYENEYAEMDIRLLSESSYEVLQRHYEKVKMTKSEINGNDAYKFVYKNDDEYVVAWDFKCEDGINRHISFIGDERIIEMSENIVKTYRLCN